MKLASLAILVITFYSPLANAQKEGDPVLRMSLTGAARLWGYEDVTFEWNMKGETQVQLKEGLSNLKEGRVQTALLNFNKAIEIEQFSWVAYYYCAIAKKILNHPNEALFDLMNASGKVTAVGLPPVYEIELERGKIYLIVNNFSGAQVFLEKAAAINPQRALSEYFLGILNMVRRDFETAEKYFLECVSKDERLVEAKVQLAFLALQKSKKIEDALTYLDAAITIDSTNVEALFTRAVFVESTNPEQALKDLNALVSHRPTSISFRIRRAIVRTRLQQFDKAFYEIKSVLEATAVDDDEFEGLETPRDKQIDIQNAGKYLVTKLFGLPDEDAALIRRAYCEMVTLNYTACLSTLRSAKDQNRSAIYPYLEALVYEHNKDFTKAFVLYEKSLQLDNDILDAHKKVGIRNYESNDWENALYHFNEMIRIDPNINIGYKLRANVCLDLKNYEKAYKDIDHYLKFDSTDDNALEIRAELGKKTGRQLESLADYIKCRKIGLIDYPEVAKTLEHTLASGDTAKFIRYTKLLDKIPGGFLDHVPIAIVRTKMMIMTGDWTGVGNICSRYERTLKEFFDDPAANEFFKMAREKYNKSNRSKGR